MKAISPMIAVVLLIAFTVAVGGILSTWLSTLATTQTSIVSAGTEKQVRCSSVNLLVREVRVNLTNPCTAGTPTGACLTFGKYANITIKYESGTATLTPNVTAELVVRGERNASTITTDLDPGESFVISLNVSRSNSTAFVTAGVTATPEIVRVRTWCQTSFPIVAECKAGEPCMITST